MSRIVRNAGWLMAGKVFHMILSFLMGLLMARYLGPKNYGLLNYAAAYCTFFTAFCTLGINSVIIKDFVDHPDEEGQAIGTTITLRLVSSLMSFCLILGIVSIVDCTEPVTIWVVALYSISLVFQVFDTLQQWFQSKLMSKYYAIATLVSYTIASAYKAFLLITGKSVAWFAVSNSIDYLLAAVVLFIFYKRKQGPAFSVSMKKAKSLLSVSSSYILSGLMVAIYSATDKFMLKQMLDESNVGYYSLAVQISTLWVFILTAIIDSMKPPIMEYHNLDRKLYLRMNKRLYAIIFYLSLGASLLICLIAPLLVEIIYGSAFLPSVSPLRIVVWYVAFSYLGVARDAWIVCERKQKYLKYLYLGSAILNVILNYLLIPIWNVNGAAVASLLTQMSTIFVFPMLFRDLRPNVKLILDAVLLRGVLPDRATLKKQ